MINKSTWPFRSAFGRGLFQMKYRHPLCGTWGELAYTVANHVCGGLLSRGDIDEIALAIKKMKFIPAGRYLYYAGRSTAFFNNCFAMKAVDTRQGWAELAHNVTSALMIGGGVGVDYSDIRAAGSRLKRTGGIASGPIPLINMVNEIGRNVMQGGNRRSALWAGLQWDHPDIEHVLNLKDWSNYHQRMKAEDFSYPAPFDMTNISVIIDSAWVYNKPAVDAVARKVVAKMCQTGEPGLAINVNAYHESLRNACCEFISDEDSDMCNLGSLNLANIEDITEMQWVTDLATRFLLCGSIKANLPYAKCNDVRDRKRKIGVGLMGLHEWLLVRGYGYEMVPELAKWLEVYKSGTEQGGQYWADALSISAPVRTRAIAPAGTISNLAGTTSGIEPMFAAAIKRRYLVDGKKWQHQYFVDPTARHLQEVHGIDPNTIETAYRLARNPRKRLKFQADVQKYVDMGISSTINLPEWGTEFNNPDTVDDLADTIGELMPELRGITAYPDNARAGQTLTEVDYEIATENEGQVFDSSEYQCKGGVCGV